MDWRRSPYVEITHKPTGIKVRSETNLFQRSIKHAKETGVILLRSILRFGWKGDKEVVRKYDLTSKMSKIKDMRSGMVTRECAGVLLEGKLDALMRSAHKAEKDKKGR